MENAAPGEPSGPVWRFLIRPRWVGWHLLMVAAFAGMLWLGDWQFHRAMSGNGLSWAYTFEWPLFAVFAVVFWARTIRDEFRIRRGEMPVPGAAEDGPADLPLGPAASVQAPQAGQAGEEDEELSAYNAYLARLNAEVKNHGRWHGLR
jgi:DNA-binding transcriptional regulator of glucitol operon